MRVWQIVIGAWLSWLFTALATLALRTGLLLLAWDVVFPWAFPSVHFFTLEPLQAVVVVLVIYALLFAKFTVKISFGSDS